MLRIGHRGAAGLVPGNPLASFEKAIPLGVDFIEVDVQRTHDGHLVIIHDKPVDRTTNGIGLVSEMSLRALRELNIGAGQPIPTPEELLQTANRRVGLILEVKAKGLAEQVCERVHRSAFTGPVIYVSLMHGRVCSLKEADPRAMTMGLFNRLPNAPVVAAQNAKATHVGFHYITATKPMVEACQQEGFVVFVYTVNASKIFGR